jgi:hypothetical protein
MAKKKLPLIESDASVRVWVNKELGKVVTDMMGTGDNLLPEDYENGYGAYSLPSVYNIEDLPDGSFKVSDLEDVYDGDIDYAGDSVSANNSSMVLMKDMDDYDKPEHFDAVMEELDLEKTGWKQVIGPALEVVQPTKKFRITFRSEIYIEAVSKEEAEEKFETMDIYSQEGLQNGEAWVETNSIEEA